MFILKGFIIVPDEDLAVVKAELPVHARLTRQEPGCMKFEVTQDPDEPNRFNVYEEFVDEPAFKAHQQRVQSSRWGTVTANVQRNYEITRDSG